MEMPDWMDDGATGPGRWGLLAGGREVAEPDPGRWRLMPPPTSGAPAPRARVSLATAALGVGQTTLAQLALGRAAGQELEAAERELALGLVADAIDRLALVLRFDPALAPVILSMADRALLAPADRHQGQVAIHLLRGDAYRGLGRETEAADAYQEAMRALSARATVKETR
jgi:tetratricopeptide (TPR) repeat protein